jgi:HEAT repeat protein
VRHRLATLTILVCALPVAAQEPEEPQFLKVPQSKWTRELSHSDAAVRRSAAFALGKMGLPAAGSCPQLLTALTDLKPGVREAAAFALGEIGPTDDSGPLVTALLKALKDDNAKVRRSAAFALGRLGARGSTVAVLGANNIDPVAIVRGNAKAAAPMLQEALADPEPIVRQSAAVALGELALPTDEAVVDAVGKLAAADDDPLVRRDAIVALGRIGLSARKTLPILVGRLRGDEDGVVRKAALDSLVEMVTADDANIADDFRKALTHRDADVVRNAALGLANIGGPSSADAVPVFRKMIAHDEDPEVRRIAFTALANIGAYAEAVKPNLIAALKDDDPLNRRSAAIALAKLREKAKDAVPALIAALDPSENKNEQVRMYVAEALGNIDPDDKRVVAAMLKVLGESQSYLVRHRAVWALERLKEFQQPGVVQALSHILIERGADAKLLRYEAAKVLAMRMDDRVPDRTVTVLLEALRDDKVFIYGGTFGKVGATREGDVGASDVKATGAGDWRRVVALAVEKIGREKAGTDEVLKELKKVAQTSPDPAARMAADNAFKELGGRD